MAGNDCITPRIFRFINDLKKNNNRAWFQANKQRFEEEVRNPLLRFIADFAGPLTKISPHFLALPTAQGGSLFRLHRDTRFSKDKKPYKENLGIHFRHEAGKSAHAPGFYLHLEPGNCFAGAGIWHPDNEVLHQIRQAIVADTTRWKKITTAKAMTRTFNGIEGDSLKRPPAGYSADHPFIEDLKRKDFFVLQPFTQKEVCDADFPKKLAACYKTAGPFVEFLTTAVSLPY